MIEKDVWIIVHHRCTECDSSWVENDYDSESLCQVKHRYVPMKYDTKDIEVRYFRETRIRAAVFVQSSVRLYFKHGEDIEQHSGSLWAAGFTYREVRSLR